MYENYENYQNYQNDQYQPTPSGKPKKSGAGKIVALALCCSLFGGIIGAGGTFALTKGTDIIKSATSSAATECATSTMRPSTLSGPASTTAPICSSLA